MLFIDKDINVSIKTYEYGMQLITNINYIETNKNTFKNTLFILPDSYYLGMNTKKKSMYYIFSK